MAVISSLLRQLPKPTCVLTVNQDSLAADAGLVTVAEDFVDILPLLLEDLVWINHMGIGLREEPFQQSLQVFEGSNRAQLTSVPF